MVRFALVLLFALSLAASAQNWEWQQFDGDYRNPTGFPGMPTCAGDFDGNGIDDLLMIGYDGWEVYITDTLREYYHWLPEPITGTQQFIQGCAMPTVVDIDDDGADELIIGPDRCAQIFSIVCWKLASTDPWAWVQRDDLIEPWMINEEFLTSVNRVAFGDIDDDGKMNIIYDTSHYIYTVLDFYDLDSTNSLVYEGHYTNTSWQSHGFIAGDFDRDGDDDLAIQADSFYTMDHTPFVVLMENQGGELLDPVLLEPTNPVYSLVIGDFDGDGDSECITERPTEPRHFALVYYQDDLQARQLTDLTSFEGRVMGNLLTVAGTPITDAVGFQNWTRTNDYGVTLGSQLKKYTNAGWSYANCDLTGEGHILTTGLSMLPDDDYPDLIEIIRTFDGSGMQERWRVLRGHRFGDGDFFYPPVHYITARFTDNPDTLFSSPQLGNADLDSVPNLYVIAKPTGEQTRIMIFESDWNFVSAPLFQNHPDWTTGLPTWIEQIRVCDLDGNGISEIFCRHDSLFWDLYFLQGARWQDYSDILPEFESTDIGFADFDNDGDVDIFTDDDVWLSLSPSPASENFILSPLSFILSCYPNPFNAVTTIRFDLPVASRVVLDVFNINGQKVQSITDKQYNAGTYEFAFDGSSLASGLYFAQLQYQNSVNTTKLMLIK